MQKIVSYENLTLFTPLMSGGVAFPQLNITYDLEKGITELLDLNQAAWEKVKKVDGYRIQIVSLSEPIPR